MIKQSIRDMWDIVKESDVRVIWISEEEKENKAEALFEEIMVNNWPTSSRIPTR